MKKKLKKAPKTKPHYKTIGITSANSDVKVQQASIHLEYLFERGINFKERIITITGDIEFPWFDTLDAALTEMESQSKATITIKVHSQGGSVYEALAMAGRMRNSKCKIVTIGYGSIMSAATLILAAGDERFIDKMAWVMHHGSSYELSYDKHEIQKAKIEQAEREEKAWAKWMGELTKKPASFWYKEGAIQDRYLDATETIKLGIVDKVL